MCWINSTESKLCDQNNCTLMVPFVFHCPISRQCRSNIRLFVLCSLILIALTAKVTLSVIHAVGLISHQHLQSMWTSPNFVGLFLPLPNNKISDLTKLKAFADNNLIVARMMISLLDKSRKHCGKRRNYQHFVHFLFKNMNKSFLWWLSVILWLVKVLVAG